MYKIKHEHKCRVRCNFHNFVYITFVHGLIKAFILETMQIKITSSLADKTFPVVVILKTIAPLSV